MKGKKWYFAAGLLLAAALLWGTGRMGPTYSIYDLTGFPAEVDSFSATVIRHEEDGPTSHSYTLEPGTAEFDQVVSLLDQLQFRHAPLHLKPKSKVVEIGDSNAYLTFGYGTQEITFHFWIDKWFIQKQGNDKSLYAAHSPSTTTALMDFLYEYGSETP